MKGVDVRTYDFDFDLTLAVLLMNADGTIYHRYGARDGTDPQSHTSVKSFVDVLRKTLPAHAAYQKNPSPPAKREPLSVDRMPWMKARPKQPECYHCHMVNDAVTEGAKDLGTFRRQMAWRYPDSSELGFTVERDDQAVVAAVTPESPAATAGLRTGDRLLRMESRRILTLGDVQRVLHEASPQATRIPLQVERAGKSVRTTLRAPKGWKEPSPRNFAWRASKWRLSPKPGFGGRRLGAAQLRTLGLDEKAFAFRVNYLVTWGEHAHTGRNAAKAGIRKGDVILATGGKSDFHSVAEWHAWFRLKLRAGQEVAVKLLRGRTEKTVTLPVVD